MPRLAPVPISRVREAHLFQVSSIFWGLWMMPLGWLAYRSGLVPKLIGVALIVGGFGYVSSFVLPVLEIDLAGYASEARVRVRGDVLQAPREPRDVALALWMFSGFLDLARPEKEAAIGRLLRRLIPGGYLVIDIAHLEQDGVLELTDQGNPYTLKLHVLTPESLIDLAEAAGFELFSQQRYTTASGKRVSCVFTVRS